MANQLQNNPYFRMALSTDEEFRKIPGEYFDEILTKYIRATSRELVLLLTDEQIRHMDMDTLSYFKLDALKELLAIYADNNEEAEINKKIGPDKFVKMTSIGVYDKLCAAIAAHEQRIRRTGCDGGYAPLEQPESGFFMQKTFAMMIEHQSGAPISSNGRKKIKLQFFNNPDSPSRTIYVKWDNALEVYNGARKVGTKSDKIYNLSTWSSICCRHDFIPFIVTNLISAYPDMPYYRFNAFLRFNESEILPFVENFEHDFLVKNKKYFKTIDRIPLVSLERLVPIWSHEDIEKMLQNKRLEYVDGCTRVVTYKSVLKCFKEDFDADDIQDFYTIDEFQKFLFLNDEEMAQVINKIGFMEFEGKRYYKYRKPASSMNSDYLLFREDLVRFLQPFYAKKVNDREFQKYISREIPDIILESMLGDSIVHLIELNHIHPGKGYVNKYNSQMMSTSKIISVLNKLAKSQNGIRNAFDSIPIADGSRNLRIDFGRGERLKDRKRTIYF